MNSPFLFWCRVLSNRGSKRAVQTSSSSQPQKNNSTPKNSGPVLRSQISTTATNENLVSDPTQLTSLSNLSRRANFSFQDYCFQQKLHHVDNIYQDLGYDFEYIPMHNLILWKVKSATHYQTDDCLNWKDTQSQMYPLSQDPDKKLDKLQQKLQRKGNDLEAVISINEHLQKSMSEKESKIDNLTKQLEQSQREFQEYKSKTDENYDVLRDTFHEFVTKSNMQIAELASQLDPDFR